MRKFTRLPVPQILETNWEIWGDRYKTNRLANNGHSFNWPQIGSIKLNQLLFPILKAQTQDHCSYCDGFPLGTADNTIDHFKPKSDTRFYKEVCAWPNLYIACADCQKLKGTQYDDLLLRPDDLEYEFNNFYTYNSTYHKIEILPNLIGVAKERAEMTLKIFGFNHPAFCKSRQISFERFMGNANPILDDFGFRFIFV